MEKHDLVNKLMESGNNQDNLAIIFQWVKQGVISKVKDFKKIIHYEYENNFTNIKE